MSETPCTMMGGPLDGEMLGVADEYTVVVRSSGSSMWLVYRRTDAGVFTHYCTLQTYSGTMTLGDVLGLVMEAITP